MIKRFFLAITILISVNANCQVLSLNDMIKIFKQSKSENSAFLKSIEEEWKYGGYEDNANWWKCSTIILKKVEGEVDHREVIIISKNKDVVKKIVEDCRRNNMKSIEGKTFYEGKNYVVLIIWEDDEQGETIFRVSLVTKTCYYNNM